MPQAGITHELPGGGLPRDAMTAPPCDRTLEELGGIYPAVNSVAVVPVGLTTLPRRACVHLEPYTPDAQAAGVIATMVEAFGAALPGRATGPRLVLVLR